MSTSSSPKSLGNPSSADQLGQPDLGGQHPDLSRVDLWDSTVRLHGPTDSLGYAPAEPVGLEGQASGFRSERRVEMPASDRFGTARICPSSLRTVMNQAGSSRVALKLLELAAVSDWRAQSKAGQAVDSRLINATSVSRIYGNTGQSNYGAAKAGIAAFRVIATRELDRCGVTVNCIATGALTRLTEDLQQGEVTNRMCAAQSPRGVAPIVRKMLADARLNAGMNGKRLDGGLFC